MISKNSITYLAILVFVVLGNSCSTNKLTFGGNGDDEMRSIVETRDDGYAMVGITKSKGKGQEDIWLLRLDDNGAKLWDRTFGTPDKDIASSIIETEDDGYAIAGRTWNKKDNRWNAWIIKVDNRGTTVWDKIIDKGGWDVASSIVEAKDGNYAIAGRTTSRDNGKWDAWIFLLEDNGTEIWSKVFGDEDRDIASSIIETEDGNYTIAGWTESKGDGKDDAWVIHIDKEGTLIWDKTFGGYNYDYALSITQTDDYGYAIAGWNSSTSRGGYDAWVIRLDGNGNKLWDKTFGELSNDKAYDIIQTRDGGFTIIGSTENKKSSNIWVVHINNEGTKLWDKTFDNKEHGKGISILQSRSDKYVALGVEEDSEEENKKDAFLIFFND